jgi:hypothetical protein
MTAMQCIVSYVWQTLCTDAIPLDAGSHKGTNPSIGEASLSMDSGSHLERDEDEEDEEGSKLQPGKHSEHRKSNKIHNSRI